MDKTEARSQLEQQIQNQETKDSGWGCDKINSRTIYFHKTTELNSSSHLKIPLRSSAILNFEKDEKNRFLWSIWAKLHPCENSNPNRGSNSRQNFDEVNIHGFDFTDGFKGSDVYTAEKLQNLYINIFESKFYKDNNDDWRENSSYWN